MSTVTPNLGLFKYNTTSDSNIAFNINTALNNNWDKIDAAINGGSSRNIGEIVASTIPLTDAGLHLLDGALIQGGGIYSAFVTYIAGLDLTANCFCTEAEWQTSITNYGVCGKFVYDSTNNTVRLPKITGILEGTTDVSALGDLVEAGLPNITGFWRDDEARTMSYSNGAFYGEQIYARYGGYYTSGDGTSTFNHKFDASRSNAIYGNSNTVQPQTIKVLYYIVVATSTKTNIQVDIDEIATDLNGKADVDLSNVPTSKGILNRSYTNGTSWYRVYSDGWCEQGGRAELSETSTKIVTFLKAFNDTSYTLLAIQTTQSTATDTEVGIQFTPTSNTQATLSCHYINPNTTEISWYACGYIN